MSFVIVRLGALRIAPKDRCRIISIIGDSWRGNENDLPRYNRFEDRSHSAAAFDTPFIGHQNTYGVAGDSKVLPGAKFISVSDGSADVCAPGVKLKSEES